MSKIAEVNRITGNNIDRFIDEDGKFFLQNTDNMECTSMNFTELEASKYDLLDRLDDGDLIVFIRRDALEGSSLQDVIFNSNVNDFYQLVEALNDAYNNAAMEMSDGQLIFPQTPEGDELVVYEFEMASGTMDDAVSAIFEDLFFSGDAERAEVVSDILGRIEDKVSEEFKEMISDLKDIADIKKGLLKEDFLSY